MAGFVLPADVAIIGGGIIGCSIAAEAAARGLRPLVIERDSIGSHASGFAFGELLPWGGRGIPGPLYDFGLRCLERHIELQPDLQRRTGVNTGFRLTDAVSAVVSDHDRAVLHERFRWLREQGAPVRWLDGGDLRAVEPRLSSQLEEGMHVGRVGVLEAYRYLLAVARDAEQNGALIRHGFVNGIRKEGDRAIAVLVGGDAIPCDAVVIAAGPWSGDATAWVGTAVPIRPLKGQIVRVVMDGPPLDTYVGWRDHYAITKMDGLLWMGSTEEDAGFDDRPTDAGRDDILLGLARVLPGVVEAGIEGHTACLRPLAADGLPIVGPAPDIDNVYLATGTGRSGLLLAPGIGQAIADLITDGDTGWDISSFTPERFR